MVHGVGFSFLFSWVLMGVVTVIFVTGGNMEKLVCEAFHTKELFKVADTPYLINPEWKNFLPGYIYNDSELDLTVESFYSQLTIFKIQKFIYTEIFTIFVCFQFTKDVVEELDTVKIDLRTITLLEAEGKRNLLDFSEAGLSEINHADYLEEVTTHSSCIHSSVETKKYTATIVGYFNQYIEWVKMSVSLMEEVAQCKPFSNILDTAEIFTCSFLVDSMNAFWMGLGCSTLFLLPSIILAVKLAKYYRRMDTEDVYDE
uniref:Prominin 1 b n=1 Tax=Periophthalmus magnuspinnatus TaxID=409849 RepID=A0A3B4AM78_9GOBI